MFPAIPHTHGPSLSPEALVGEATLHSAVPQLQIPRHLRHHGHAAGEAPGASQRRPEYLVDVGRGATKTYFSS